MLFFIIDFQIIKIFPTLIILKTTWWPLIFQDMQMKLVLWPNTPFWAENDESTILWKDKHSFTRLFNYWNFYQTEWLWKTQTAQQFTLYWMIKRHKSWKWVGTKIKGFYRHKYAKKENESGGRNLILLSGIRIKSWFRSYALSECLYFPFLFIFELTQRQYTTWFTCICQRVFITFDSVPHCFIFPMIYK